MHKILAMVVSCFVVWAMPSTLFAASKRQVITGPVAAELVEVIDGDSLRVTALIWPGQKAETIVRLRGVDTPERRGKCASERRLAEQARLALAGRIGSDRLTLTNVSGGKYFGRVLADVRLPDGGDLSNFLLAHGLAVPYGGARRLGWC